MHPKISEEGLLSLKPRLSKERKLISITARSNGVSRKQKTCRGRISGHFPQETGRVKYVLSGRYNAKRVVQTSMWSPWLCVTNVIAEQCE